MNLNYLPNARKNLERLEPDIGLRILDKMQWFAYCPKPLLFAKPLRNINFATHRFRIGDYRVLVKIDMTKNELCVVLSSIGEKHMKRIDFSCFRPLFLF